MEAAEALASHSQRLLEAFGAADWEQTVPHLLQAREALLEDLRAALGRGETLCRDEARRLLALDLEIREVVLRRREVVCSQLSAVRHGRAATSAYGPYSEQTSRYMDRNG